ncbi:thiamine pyrophosphokinase [Acetobacter pasteurianus]|uniref:Thiamine diphosphokinase n=1 Tax=Acetobacter pasteurianus TaxID=438 RepID=A0A1A0DP38_ACEPA|nr:NUDIX domain-containing protein [Acetobacter pasteurianus]OAZ76839.1 Thiamine diphosphokinase [Acetobacter pasteurianus]RCL08984.1 thiamine pyrophosphokinase [Acetobacter pasteurianus]GAB31043.1 thiamin pyrophosphokinase [Acetobacter pasteurianus subsp. pasteurianus LMG 1262 = NBRC 106471]GCD49973.1 thiamin pyrophosphokinase [Acetobacter pasteurianus subsp. pasteurianus LMG 1262 = NBRC 106471]
MSSDITPFLRHLKQCNTAIIPGKRAPFSLAGKVAGWITPELFDRLEKEGLGNRATSFNLPDPSKLEALGEALAQEGFYRSHHELFDVRTDVGEPAIARIDRGALPLFGLVATGVHMNGLVRKADGLHLWTGRRAANKRLDPSKLDHLVAGGVPAGHTPREALIKEAAEEASIPHDLAAQAQETGHLVYAMERPEGLRRDILVCYDLYLPENFEPEAADGEVESFALLPLAKVFQIVRDTDEFKFNVNLVLIDLFLRHGLIDTHTPAGQQLRAGLNHGLSAASPGHHPVSA